MFSFAYNSSSIDSTYPVIKETVPKSSLGYNTNNMYPKFPPMMADGRSAISSWQPESAVNDKLIKTNDIKSNWEYRKYLSQHGYQIMEYNFRETCNDTGYHIITPELDKKSPPMVDVPYNYASYSDNTHPPGYQDSDLKQIYLSREQLNSRKVAPTIR